MPLPWHSDLWPCFDCNYKVENKTNCDVFKMLWRAISLSDGWNTCHRWQKPLAAPCILFQFITKSFKKLQNWRYSHIIHYLYKTRPWQTLQPSNFTSPWSMWKWGHGECAEGSLWRQSQPEFSHWWTQNLQISFAQSLGLWTYQYSETIAKG